MRSCNDSAAALLAAVLACGCGSDAGAPRAATPPGGVPGGPGTCANPIRLETAATHQGTSLIYEGTTEGFGNVLHPYDETPSTDSSEVVLEFRVPAGMTNVKITTEGSAFDTILYVRETCAQRAGGGDLALGDYTPTADPDMDADYATLYLTGQMPGQVRYLVVDGRAMADPPAGRFRLTISPFTPGAMGEPCADDGEGHTNCEGRDMRCSPANRCVPTVATGERCDERGINNTCLAEALCVSDPGPSVGEAMPATCAAAGTRPGARCRDGATRCDSPYVCNDAREEPFCIRLVGAGEPCDPMGMTNRCMTGLRCVATGPDASACAR